MPPSMGPGARPLEPGESPGSLLKEITEIRSKYNVHLSTDAIELAYELKGQARHYRLPFDNMPVGGWTKALCFGGPSSTAVSGTLLIDMIRGTENASGRQITQEEAEGIAFYGSRRMLTMYFGQVAAIGLGVGAAWFGRKTMKFPFRSPKPMEAYEAFPMRRLPMLKGQFAKTMWHITRANVYIVMWLFLTNPLFRSMADTRMTVGLYQDRRTHGLTEELRGKFDRLKSNRESGAARQPVPQPQKQQGQDDASPAAFDDRQTFGNEDGFAADNTFTDSRTDTGLITDRALQQRQTQEASPNSWSRAQSRATKSQQEQEQSTSSGDYFFDDASLTAGNESNMATSQNYNKQPSGSAWSRKRRTESSQYNQDDRQTYGRQSQDFETKGDSFSFSESEEERRLAKQQAQKDFDAMLDRERRDGGSAEYVRDMQATTSNANQEASSSTESAWSKYRKGR